MWKRIELHNHTYESDGKMSCEELVTYLHSCNIDHFSLTDHNTVSGWNHLPEIAKRYDMEYIQGLELTTYYGHLLAQNINSYVTWDDLSEENADLLFKRIHDQNGLAGPAHPFTVPSPFSNGMNWSMKIHDYNLVDFIEIINNAHPMFPDNRKAIEWWEKLVLQGFRIAPVSGMDLHKKKDMSEFYTTFIYVSNPSATLSKQLEYAVRNCRTQVTKGPLLHWNIIDQTLEITIDKTDIYDQIFIEVKSPETSCIAEYTSNPCIFHYEKSLPVTVKAYYDTCDYSHLIAVAGPIQADKI